jgi:hypothetical protein
MISWGADMTDREQWADDHGYWHGTCPRHGSFWTDGSGCDNCLDDKEEYEEPGEDQFRCDNCGEFFDLAQRKMSDEFEYCPTCVVEFEPQEKI